jgi:hypothetical protein
LGHEAFEERVAGLCSQGSLVEGIAEDAKSEDGEGEGVAAVVGVAAGELGEGFVVVLPAGGDVPEGWVEDNASC